MASPLNAPLLSRVRVIDEGIRAEFIARQEEHAARVALHDAFHLDVPGGTARWSRNDEALWEGIAEPIARWYPEFGLLRWWWSTTEVGGAGRRMDEAFAEAQRSDLKALATRQLNLDDEVDAEMLCRVAAYYANARAMIRRTEGDEISYYALFDTKPNQRLVRFAADPLRTLPPSAGYESRSVPPPAMERPSQPPLAARVLREPSREILLPLANVAGKVLRRACPLGYRQAILIVSVDTSREKARFFVQLVVLDQAGDLDAVDTTRELLDTVATFIGDDIKSGNARWRKFTVRLVPEGDAGVGLRSPEVFA
jgi:hypothetical protein